MDGSNQFRRLKWKIPDKLKNFVPIKVKCISSADDHVVIAWHKRIALLYVFTNARAQNVPSCISSQIPKQEVIMTNDNTLDVIDIGGRICFVSIHGQVEVLSYDVRTHLKCQLTRVHNLCPALKKIVAVTKVRDACVAAVTCSSDCSHISVDVYSVVWVADHKVEFKSILKCDMPNTMVSKDTSCTCFVAVCNKTQAPLLFGDSKDADFLLLGVPSRQVYYLPIYVSTSKHVLKKSSPRPKLLYQAPWPIIGLFCPSDGSKILVFLDCGLLVMIFPNSTNTVGSKPPCLSFSSVSLTCSGKSFCALNSSTILCSNPESTWLAQLSDTQEVDSTMLLLKGVTSLGFVEGQDGSACVAATLHNTFYLFDSSGMSQNILTEDDANPRVWSGFELDSTLRYVQEMKEQTDLLQQLNQLLKAEDSVLMGLSVSSRAHLLASSFSISAKVSERNLPTEETAHDSMVFSPSHCLQNYEWNYVFSIEVKNNSDQEFAPPLWEIYIAVENPTGINLCKSFVLHQHFTEGASFKATIPVSLSSVEMVFPINVHAHLVAEVEESSQSVSNQWLSIPLGTVALDVSYFFSLSLSQPLLKNNSSVITYLDKLDCNYKKSVNQKTIPNSDEQMTTHSVPVPEPLRSAERICSKLFPHDQHQSVVQDLQKAMSGGKSDSQKLWIALGGKLVQMTVRKSCSSISLASANLEVLHLIKSWLVKSLQEAGNDSSVPEGILFQAKKLKALLEAQQLEDSVDSKNVILLYQDLRRNISAQLP